MKTLRWAGLLPLASWAFRFETYHHAGQGDEAYWICTLSNLLLSAGLFFGQADCVWVATLWIILGTPFWLADVLFGGSFHLSSVLTHLGSLVVGLFALRKMPAKRPWIWASLYLVAVFFVSQRFADPSFNVNLTARIPDFMTPYFSRFWLYSCFNLVFFSSMLYTTEKLVLAGLLSCQLAKTRSLP